MKRRVVVTGLGVVSSIGTGHEEFWQNLVAGTSGISRVEGFDTSRHQTHYGAEIKSFDKREHFSVRKSRFIGKASRFTVACAQLALRDAGLDVKNKDDVGVSLGTTFGEAQEIEGINEVWVRRGEDKGDFRAIRRSPLDNIPSNLANILRLRGPVRIFATACSAGNYAIGYGYDIIRQGEARTMIAGGSDVFSRVSFTGFNQLGVVAPEKCQPFDKNRKGMMVGEGAGIMVLELLEDALKRRAKIYAEILGYGLSCDAHHMANPDSEGIAQCMLKAMRDAGISEKQVDYICAHGSGTRQNDAAEAAALRKIFGDRIRSIPVNSIKSMLGHAMGAASAIEAVACCLVVANDIIPPTINFETLDPDCDVDCVPNKARKKKVDIALNNGFAFGGNNSCLVIKKFEKE